MESREEDEIMSEKDDWSWWVGHDDERHTTECGSRDEAVQVAKNEYDGGYICEAKKPSNIKISRYFDGHMFAENAEDSASEDHGDPEGGDEIFKITPDQRKDMQIMVRAAMDAWQEKHGLTFTGFQFSASRNHEHIPAPDLE